MTDKVRIEGFDTEPGALDDAFSEGAREQAERHAQAAAATQKGVEKARRANDVLVDRRMLALRDHVVQLHHKFGGLDTKVDSLDGKVDDVQSQMKTFGTKLEANTSATLQMLDILKGGKFLVSAVKFLGALAVPVTAIIALIHTFKGPT